MLAITTSPVTLTCAPLFVHASLVMPLKIWSAALLVSVSRPPTVSAGPFVVRLRKS